MIKAPGATGVSVLNQTGAKTDWRGYTVVSNLSVYRKNNVALLTDSLADNVELELTNKTVVPTRGAVVRADYIADVGIRMLLTLTQDNGAPVPFGAILSASSDNEKSFIVGDKGQVFITGYKEGEYLIAQWGINQKCSVQKIQPQPEQHNGIVIINAACR